jgi:serine/threonine protein kinase
LQSQDDIEPLPQLDESIKFHDWTLMAKGTHSRIYRTKQVGAEDSPFFCVKIFRRGWMTPFNLERAAYEHLQAAKIEGYIPHVYGFDSRTLSTWGISAKSEDDELHYAIVMEWIENGEQVSSENISISSAAMLIAGLEKVHKVGVLHNDIYKRNILVVRDEDRGVWTDFSCAYSKGQEDYLGQEMSSARGIVLEMVREFASRG